MFSTMYELCLGQVMVHTAAVLVLHCLQHFLAMQEKFDERWQALLVPKLAEEDMHTRTDEAAVRRQRLDKAQVQFHFLLLMYRDTASVLSMYSSLC